MKKIAFSVFLLLWGAVGYAQSSGVFCTDLIQIIHYAPDNFATITGETLAVKTGNQVKEWKATLPLAGTMGAVIAQGPEPGIWHYYCEMNTGKEATAATYFRDNLALMTKNCLEAMDFKVTESKIKSANGTEGIEQIFINYDFPASRQMKIAISILSGENSELKVKFDLLFKP